MPIVIFINFNIVFEYMLSVVYMIFVLIYKAPFHPYELARMGIL